MAVDQNAYKGLVGEVLNSDPANGAVAVSPSDTNDIDAKAVTNLSRIYRGLWVGVGGNVKVTMADGSAVTFLAVPTGFLLPIRYRQVFSTGTTATTMIALY